MPCRLLSTAKDSIFAFGLATGGTVLGTLAAWKLVGRMLGSEGWKVSYSALHSVQNSLDP